MINHFKNTNQKEEFFQAYTAWLSKGNENLLANPVKNQQPLHISSSGSKSAVEAEQVEKNELQPEEEKP